MYTGYEVRLDPKSGRKLWLGEKCALSGIELALGELDTDGRIILKWILTM
jgi:hypothetical protein